MLYVVHGDQTDNVRQKAAELRIALHKKRPDAELFKLDEEQVTHDRLQELAGGQGLFERKYIVQIDRVTDNSDAREAVLAMASAIATSDNVFLVVEGTLEKKTRDTLSKEADKVYAYQTTGKAKQEFNIFVLTDALGKRDKKTLWVEFWKARRAHKEAEEIHGILFWQVKAMLMARVHKSADEAGMKPFPYKKAKEFAGNYSDEELADLSRRLVQSYHEARRGNGNLADNVERFVLSL